MNSLDIAERELQIMIITKNMGTEQSSDFSSDTGLKSSGTYIKCALKVKNTDSAEDRLIK